jgi:alanine racemase
VIRSPKSYNSQVGVPLSVIAIEKHNLGILKQEFLLFLKWLLNNKTNYCATSIGSSHDEGFESTEQKIKENCFFKD